MRVPRGAITAAVQWQPIDQDGEPADPIDTVTASAVRSNGDTVTLTGVTGTGTAPRQTTIAADALTDLDIITVSWSVGTSVVATSTVNVVERLVATPGSIRDQDPTLSGHDDADVRRAVDAVTDLFEAELHRFMVPRLVVVPCRQFVPNEIEQRWEANGERAVIAGMSSIPGDLFEAFVMAVRMQLSTFSKATPGKAESWRTDDGLFIANARAGIGENITGNDDIDAAIKRHHFEPIGIA